MYEVIGNRNSRTTRVLWMLEEIGAEYRLTEVPPQAPEVRSLNPSGKIPVMVADGTALTDSTAILHYLADSNEALTFPAGTVDRARQDAATFFLLDEFDALLWFSARHSFALPEVRRVPAVKDSLRWEYGRSLERLAGRLGDGPYLMGDTMTVADIIAGHCLSWAVVARFPRGEGAVADYLERLRARPAFRRAMAQ
ncbi:glutathione S-transferase family protein [Pseudoruegeria sp. HB172150]|uniref:glutathione S-transferase family protein n=1 Tax=Pseudoruegeria sp. HB172150 TaxID=2721164 RepID=UPI001551EE85|nr:glutathione S-transferase family protein [Pseudoruegeria sp. HB172150]